MDSMHDPFDASTIIFALLAIFVLWKLRSTLGTRGGAEKPPAQNANPFFRTSTAANENKVVPLPGSAPRPAPPPPLTADPDRWKAYAEPGFESRQRPRRDRRHRSEFWPRSIHRWRENRLRDDRDGLCNGDRELLARLLDKDVFDSFNSAIDARAARGESLMTKVVSIDKTGVFDAGVRDGMLQITLRFMATLISATHDKDGKVIDGDPEKTVNMVDLWTFARPAASRDPNWKLVATQTGH